MKVFGAKSSIDLTTYWSLCVSVHVSVTLPDPPPVFTILWILTQNWYTVLWILTQSSFLPKTIRDWNSLPMEVVQAPTLHAFVSRVWNGTITYSILPPAPPPSWFFPFWTSTTANTPSYRRQNNQHVDCGPLNKRRRRTDTQYIYGSSYKELIVIHNTMDTDTELIYNTEYFIHPIMGNCSKQLCHLFTNNGMFMHRTNLQSFTHRSITKFIQQSVWSNTIYTNHK